MSIIIVKNKSNDKIYRVLEDAIFIQNNKEEKIIIYKEIQNLDRKIYAMIEKEFWKLHDLFTIKDLSGDME